MEKITVDNGNNTRNGVVISENFRKKIGVRFCSLKKNVIKMAGSEKMTHLGDCQISIKIKGLPRIVSKASVLKELKDGCNIGTAFLQKLSKKARTSLEFTSKGTTLQHGKRRVELVQQLEEEDTKVGIEIPLRAGSDVTVEPRSVKFIGTDKKIPGKILTQGVDLGKRGAIAATAVYEHSGKIAIMNTSGNRLRIRKSQVIGQAIPVVYSDQSEASADVAEVRKIEADEDIEKIFEDLGIEENERLAANPKLKRKVKELIQEYRDIFGTEEQRIG